MEKKKDYIVDMDSLVRFTDAIGSYSQYLIQRFEGQLFHYTDLNALISIVRNHDLWLTHAQYSNDEKEVKHGYEIAKGVIDKRRKKSRNKREQVYFDHVTKFVDEPLPKGVYICCFCTEDNLLSQWRGYGENGTGVSIAFDPLGFARYSGPDLPPENLGLMRLWEVFYKREVQENIVEKALELVPRINDQDSEEVKARKTADAIHFFIPTFKDSDFEGEKERRLIFTPARNCLVEPQYRVGKGMLVPYYSLKALGKCVYGSEQPLPITGVTIGPGVRKDLNVESVKMLLEQNGYEKFTVSSSDTPYRG